MTILTGPLGSSDTNVSTPEVFHISVIRTESTAVSGRDVWPAFPGPPTGRRSAAWLIDFRRQVLRLGELPEDWDSYGARALRPEAVLSMLRALRRMGDYISVPPEVRLTVDGGLQVEWRGNHVRLSLVAEPDGMVGASYSDLMTDDEWEGPAAEAPHLDKWLWLATNSL